jgi:hypothetical protein
MRDKVRVKISSDSAGAIALTPVVVQEMTVAELAEHVVAVCSKDAVRIRDIIQGGSLVSGASRLRWEGWSATEEEVALLLSGFPDPDPGRPLQFDRCATVILHAGAQKVVVPRKAAEKRKLLRKKSLWSVLSSLPAQASYSGYSYREKCDVYRMSLPAAGKTALRDASALVPYASLAHQLSSLSFHEIEFHIPR